jgi:hypothetical protein
MSEWWTYSLSDFLLFSPRTYYRLFELYNLAVWPWHVLPQNFLHGRRPTVQLGAAWPPLVLNHA